MKHKTSSRSTAYPQHYSTHKNGKKLLATATEMQGKSEKPKFNTLFSTHVK